MRWVGHAARMGEMRNAYQILRGKHERTRPIGKSRCRWEYIKMDLRKLEWEIMN
jgi:hypothetical protein